MSEFGHAKMLVNRDGDGPENDLSRVVGHVCLCGVPGCGNFLQRAV